MRPRPQTLKLVTVRVKGRIREVEVLRRDGDVVVYVLGLQILSPISVHIYIYICVCVCVCVHGV